LYEVQYAEVDKSSWASNCHDFTFFPTSELMFFIIQLARAEIGVSIIGDTLPTSLIFSLK